MIYQSFILANLVSLCLKIVNSVVVVGLYYGFLTTLSIGPSYLFLIRARVMEERTEKKVSATTGFITGQLMMFISIYYAPLHLALSRPHTITALTLPYLLFNFFDKNDKYYYLDSGYKLDYRYKNRNSIRNLSIYKVFFNNLLFQLLNPLLFPSSILIRLVNIYLFRCNNKLLFLTSSFVGWLIGHIFLMKWIGLILVWLQQNNSIKSKVTIRFDKYIMLKFRDYVGQIFAVFSFIILLHYLGRIPLPHFFTEEMLEIGENDEIGENEEVGDLDVERAWETPEQKGFVDEYLSSNFFSPNDKTLDKIEEERDLFEFQKPLVTILFDFQRWNRPLRYIKNDHFENVVRNENSQFFFHICQSDGKERISFTYPPDLSTFLKIMEKKMDLFTRDKISYKELSNYWSSTNKEKRKKLSNEFFKRAKVLDKESLPLDVFENRIRLCKDETKTKYISQIYDPFLNGRFRGQIQTSFSPSIQNETYTTSIQNETYTTNHILINKIHGLLLAHDPEFEQKIDPFDRKSLLTEIGFFFNFISKFSEKSVSSLNFDGLSLFPEHEQVKIYSEEKKRKKRFLFDSIRTDLNDETIFNTKKCIGINEISKKVPRWSYNLIDDLEQLTEGPVKEAQIRCRKADRIVIFNSKTENYNEDLNTMSISNTDDNEDGHTSNIDDTIEPNQELELALLNYSREPDFNRELISGSMRAQRRKTVTWKLFQSNAHSPLFLDKIRKSSFFFGDLFDDISQYLKEYFRKKGTDNSEFLAFEKRIEEDQKEEKKYNDEKRLIEIEEAWENILYGLILRSFVLIIQSFLRKYILLPSLIITKNIIRILLFQNPEWSEDFRDWKKEVHIKCTYQGIPVSNKEFPNDWLTEGLQIRILSPFVLKPWHKSKVRSTEKKKRSTEKKNVKTKNFWFLTACGTQVESYLDNYFPNPFSFLGPIFQKIKKQLNKDLKNRFFLVLKVLNESKKWFLTILKEIGKWNIKSILFRFKKRYELSESKKDSTISKNNPMIYESPVLIQSIDWTNCSLTEKKIKDLNVKTKTIIKQIEKMTQEEKGEVITSEKDLNSNKTTYDAKRLELQKNIFQILQRRNVRLTRKLYSFFKFFMERVYIDILLCIISIPRINGELFLESTKKIVNKSTKNYNKKTNAERIDKTNQSIIPFMSIIHKSCNITNTNSQNSCDVSSLSQAYVFFKLSQTQVLNVYKYKLRSILESHGRPFFLKNEIKNHFFRIQGIFNSKLRDKNVSDSVMNQWTNWLKVHYQYDLPESRWSRLVPQNWRNRINEHRVAQNKDLIEYDSEYDSYENEKRRLILYKKQQVDLLKSNKKIKKQYGYDLLAYKYLNYADKQKSDIYGYRLPFQANKNQAISYNDNTRKKEFLDITGDISIQNYIAEDVIIDRDMEKNLDRKYFDWMVMDVEIRNHSISKSNPKLGFFLKLWKSYHAYKKNPWILPTKLLFFDFYGKDVSETKNITGKKKRIDFDEFYLDTQNGAQKSIEEYENLKSSLSNQDYERSDRENGDNSIDENLYRNDLKGERDFLLEKYLGFHLNYHSSLQERIMNNIKFYCLLIRLKNLKKFFIISIQRGDLSLDTMAIQNHTDFTLTGFKDNTELVEKQFFFIEPVRLSRKNYEQFFMYQTTSLSLIHKKKRQMFQRNPEKRGVDKNHYDLLVPENVLSTRRRRELRILICFNPRNTNTINDNENKINNCCQALAKNKDLDRETKKLMNLKFFLWPNYRLEDLACINRYWFDTHNGSRFSILRIKMYPRLKI
uniref:Protein TIC 214 n=1 Tax=Caragana kozlowii TaxID=1641311 RepID=A0A1Z1CNR1_9FABA|nr:hypothetical chloroplast RF1 [Caragana kozlowii]APL97339.1 hypothetical chloroplast RF1 [Caragana kozlowii]AVP25258.1 hypothetical chloroplast RF1 [Caragana kozlowii]